MIILTDKPLQDKDETVSNHSSSEILDITFNNITSSSHHQVIDRKRKITNIPHLDSILLSKLDDNDSTREDEDNLGTTDDRDTHETVRKASDISNISKLSYGINPL